MVGRWAGTSGVEERAEEEVSRVRRPLRQNQPSSSASSNVQTEKGGKSKEEERRTND